MLAKRNKTGQVSTLLLNERLRHPPLNQIVEIVLPVFGLIGVGYAIARFRVLPEGSDQALADFVFLIAIPPLIFRTIVSADLGGSSPWLLWLAYYTAFGTTWVTGTFVVRRVFKRDARAGVVGGLSAAYANSLLLGLPLVLTAYGEQGAATISLLVAVNLPVMMTVGAVLIERALVADGQAGGTSIGASLVSAGRALVKNPIIIAVFVALVWRLLSLPTALGPVSVVINRLADVGGTMALFAVGMNLVRYSISGNVLAAIVLTVIKLALMPALVFLLVATVIHLPPVWAKSLVIAAACPTGVNAWVVASRFRTGQALASNAITISTAAAVISVAVWLRLVEFL
jgi:predicted permease